MCLLELFQFTEHTLYVNLTTTKSHLLQLTSLHKNFRPVRAPFARVFCNYLSVQEDLNNNILHNGYACAWCFAKLATTIKRSKFVEGKFSGIRKTCRKDYGTHCCDCVLLQKENWNYVMEKWEDWQWMVQICISLFKEYHCLWNNNCNSCRIKFIWNISELNHWSWG